jgi:outer membrane protein assembly factor BamB
MSRAGTAVKLLAALSVLALIAFGIRTMLFQAPPIWTSTGGVTVQWHREVGPVYGPVIFANDMLYVKTNGLSALEPATGHELWQVNVPNPQWLVHDGDMIFTTGIYAIDARTGRIRWHADPGEGMIVEAGVQGSRRLFAACGDGGVCAFNKTDGRELWGVDVGRRVDAMAAGDGMVFVGDYDGYVVALDAVTGAERWRVSPAGLPEGIPDNNLVANTVISGLTAVRGTVYVQIRGGILVALSAATGEEEWGWTIQKGPPPITRTWFPGRPPVVAGGLLYIATEYHDLFAIDAETGRDVWRLEVAWPGRATPEASPASEGPLALDFVDASTGKRRWRAEIGNIQESPIFVNDAFLVSTCLNGNCSFFALDSATGERRWNVTTDGFVHEPAVTTEAIFGGTSWTRVEFPSARKSGGSIFALALTPELPS